MDIRFRIVPCHVNRGENTFKIINDNNALLFHNLNKDVLDLSIILKYLKHCGMIIKEMASTFFNGMSLLNNFQWIIYMKFLECVN